MSRNPIGLEISKMKQLTLYELIDFFDKIKHTLEFQLYADINLAKVILQNNEKIGAVKCFLLERSELTSSNHVFVGKYSMPILNGRINSHPERYKPDAWGSTDTIVDSVIMNSIFMRDLRVAMHDHYCPKCEELAKDLERLSLDRFLKYHIKDKHILTILSRHLQWKKQ
jgi:hypothetical protein